MLSTPRSAAPTAPAASAPRPVREQDSARRAAVHVPPARRAALPAIVRAPGGREPSRDAGAWTGRVAALNALLLSHDSATLALEHWCRAHGIPAEDARVVAEILARRADEAPAAVRFRLGLRPAETVRYRRVRLCCAGRVLSEADNWYVPDRLTPGMNRLLDRTDAPFGRVVRSLRFRRRLLSVEPLRAPPESRQAKGGAPPQVLRHRAVLVDTGGAPFSAVVETYTREALFLPETRT